MPDDVYVWFPSGTWIHEDAGAGQSFTQRSFWVEAVRPTRTLKEVSIVVNHTVCYRNASGQVVVHPLPSVGIPLTINELSIMWPSGSTAAVDAHFLNIGHWGDDHPTLFLRLTGFYGAGGAFAVKQGAATGHSTTFVDEDPDRFVVMLVRAASNANTGAIDEAEVTFGTLKTYDPSGAVDDPYHTLYLTETGDNTATFISESQLLAVNDQVLSGPLGSPGATYQRDSEQKVYSPRMGAMVEHDDTNDRLHRVLLDGGGHAIFTIPGCENGPTRQSLRPVSEQRCQLAPPHDRLPQGILEAHIRIRVHLEPFKDTGYPFTFEENGVTQTIDMNINESGRVRWDIASQSFYYDRDLTGSRDPTDWLVIVHAGSGLTPDWRTWKVSVEKVGMGGGKPFCDRGFDFLDLPDTDGKYNGVHDNGEISEEFRDLSSYNWGPPADDELPPMRRGDHAQAGAWGPVATPAKVQRQLDAANVSWAQAAVRIVQIGGIIEQYANAVMFTVGGWFDPHLGSDWWINHINSEVTPTVAEVTFTAPAEGFAGIAFFPLYFSEQTPVPAYAENSYCFIGANPRGRLSCSGA